MASGLAVGLRHTSRLVVGEAVVVPAMAGTFAGFADMPPVLATAFLVAFIEATCVEAVRPFLDADEQTVGVAVEVSHVAATPVGMAATAEVELIAIEGRKLRFRVACRDEAGPIGAGFHERAIIRRAPFLERARKRGAG